MRSHLPTLATALIAGTAVAVGPTIAEAAYDAVNADKVDGKSAVGAAAAPGKRAGKLVATNGRGMLPDDIIDKAADADLLDGIDSAGFLAAGGKAADAEMLDGMSSDSFVQGTGNVRSLVQALPPGPGSQSTPLELPGTGGPVQLRYFCPQDPSTQAAAFYVFNNSTSVLDVHAVRAGEPARYEPVSPGAYMYLQDGDAASAGHSLTWTLVQPGSGRLTTVQTTSLRTSTGCSISAQALTTTQ